MVNYIHAECYKVFRRKYPYVFVGIFLVLMAAFMLLLRVEGLSTSMENDTIIVQRISVAELLSILAMLLSSGLYLLLMAADMVFSEQYKYNTLKNEVSFGLPRLRIYFGKLFTSMLAAVVLCAVLVGGYMGIGFLLFPAGENFGDSLHTFGLTLLMALPLWLGGLGFFHMLQFLMKGSTASTIAYIMVIAILGSGFLDLMSILMPSLEPVANLVRTISLNTPFSLMSRQGPEGQIGYAWILGMSWLGISTVIGLVGFHKKEIN